MALKFVCPKCRSDDISMDQVVVWNIAEQMWKPDSDRFTEGGCYECEEQFDAPLAIDLADNEAVLIAGSSAPLDATSL